MNPIRWLFRDESLIQKEKKLDEDLERIKEKVRSSGSSMLVEIDKNFPEDFTKLSEEIVMGYVEWRDFYSNRTLDIYSVHCRLNKGAGLKEHRHPGYDEYIYVVSGKIINWIDSNAEARIITPPEKVDRETENIKAWHKIPSGVNHRIQALENHTHFISKFLKPDV